jgi:hypothetical protein
VLDCLEMSYAPQGHSRLRYSIAPISFIVALSFLVTIPLLRFGIPYGMDAAEHLSWYRCFVAQLWDGELYPRWLQGMNGGLGSPDLFVYGPLPYYAAAVFHVLTGTGREVYDLGLSMVLAVILAGLAAWFWLGQLAAGRLLPALGAIVYMVVPYYFITDLYTRVALAELWTFAWMPLILYFTAALLRRRSPAAFAGLAIAWGLLFITHLFTAMLFAPLSLAYAGWMASSRQRAASLAIATAGMLFGAALSAFYLFPALSYEKYISAWKLIQTRPDYRFDRNFLFSGIARTPYLNGLSRQTAWTVVVAGLFAASGFMTDSGRMFREALWWIAVAAASFVMMLPVSGWFWQHVPLLGAIQFPSRLNTLLTVATAALAATGMESLRRQWQWRKAALVGLALLLTAGWVRPLFYAVRYQNAHLQQLGTVNLDYLITAWAQWTDPKLLSLRGIPLDAGTPKAVSGNGTAVAGRWEPRLIEIHADSPAATWVTVKQFYFPLWTATLAQGRPLPLRPSSPEGLIVIQVPAGVADVRLRLAHGVPEIAGAALSGLAATGLILLACRRQRIGTQAPFQ